MGIFHDAYPFHPDKFVADVRPYVEKLDTRAGYEILREAAIKQFESSATVQKLCSEYGGWDKNSILTQISPDGRGGVDDIAFWVVLLLYSSLSPVGPHLYGLGNNWALMQPVLTKIGWATEEIDLLNWGHSFGTLAGSDAHPVWQRIHTFGISSSAGWLRRNEVESLWPRLVQAQDTIGSHAASGDVEANVVRAALEMITIAREHNSGLCILASG